MSAGVENILFMFDNAADRATISATSEVASLPASNLLDAQRSQVWRSTSGADQSIDITLAAGEVTPIGAVALVDHNLTPGGSIRLQGWSDAIAGSAQTVDVTVEPWAAFYGYGVGQYGVGGYGGTPNQGTRTLLRPIVFIPLPDFSQDRYWRITLSDSSLSYHQAGRIYLGGVWQPKVNISRGWTLRREGRTRKIETRGGQAYGNKSAGRVSIECRLDWLSPADRDELYLNYLRVEDHTPFIVCVRPAGGIEQIYTTIYGQFEAFKYDENLPGNARSPMKIVEAL